MLWNPSQRPELQAYTSLLVSWPAWDASRWHVSILPDGGRAFFLAQRPPTWRRSAHRTTRMVGRTPDWDVYLCKRPVYPRPFCVPWGHQACEWTI